MIKEVAALLSGLKQELWQLITAGLPCIRRVISAIESPYPSLCSTLDAMLEDQSGWATPELCTFTPPSQPWPGTEGKHRASLCYHTLGQSSLSQTPVKCAFSTQGSSISNFRTWMHLIFIWPFVASTGYAGKPIPLDQDESGCCLI